MKIYPAFAAALVALTPNSASAHVTVLPKDSSAGAREKLVIRVPNEKDVETVALELTFPAGLKVTAVEQKPDWMAEALRTADGTLSGVRWTGRLAPQQFTEFGLLAIMPAKPGTISFGAIQSFADGTRIAWSGPQASRTPAPQVIVGPSR
jgi:hypothetical protein